MATPPDGPLAVIAGGGQFPAEIVEAVRRTGRAVTVIGLRGFSARKVAGEPVLLADMLDPSKVLGLLREIAPACVVLAGTVTRPGPLAIASVFHAYRNRDELGRILAGGDDRILRGVVSLLEQEGFRVVGAQEVAPDLLAPAGALTRRQPDEQDLADMRLAGDILAATGRFDIGQGVVVAQGRVLAVEGPEGTDAMLERVVSLRRSRRVKLDGSAGVLVKRPKPGQDVRVDLPAVGPRTVAKARAAGLKGIAVEAGAVVVVDRPGMVGAADLAGLFLWGIA
ncbi:MAG: UDP-2,3-diacylglucosamine diphosphatase LpxI [Alsobacter sp.]